MQEGQIVRNKRTGQMGRLVGGQVVPIDQGPINSGARPSDVTAARNSARGDAQFAYQVQRDAQEDARREEEDRRAREEDQQLAARSDEAARSKLIATVGKLSQLALDANDNNGWFETGTSGRFARNIPGANAGKDLSQDMQTIEARFAFDSLQAMRDASKTGGALGQVTERELDLLKAAVAAISPDMTHDTFMRNVEQARQAYLSKLAMVDPDSAARMGYDAEQAEAAWMRFNDTYASELGYGAAQPTVSRQPGTQSQQELPADIDAIMKKYGAGQ
jgi:hypothetical protein